MIKLKNHYILVNLYREKIIIIPDEIRIDNYYKPPIFLFKQYKDYEETRLNLELHLKELIEELL
jgi:hypothetical protein